MTTLKWDNIKTIGDQDAVDDVSSDSDIEIEVILIIFIDFIALKH
jgi:hypothetical protein